MITIAKETPHMFMWFSDGSKIPNGISPLPHNAKLDYVKRLKEECAKLLRTKTPVYLVYMGRLLSREQQILLEDLQNEIPNLAVIDYDEVEQNNPDELISSKVASAANSYKKHEILDVGKGGIADLVDFTRLILLYKSKSLREIAQRKIKIPLEWHKGLVYRDFDVTLEKESMPDIPTTNGYMATLNFLEKVHADQERLIKSAKGNENLIIAITLFFDTYIYNLERYQQILRLFLKKELTIEEQNAKQNILSEYKKICNEDDNFQFIFINHIFIENSFLAISTDQHPLIGKMIKNVCDGDSPYAAVQNHFRSEFRGKDYINEYLVPQKSGFNIGNDLTWKLDIKQQHQLEDSPPPMPTQSRPQQQEHVSEVTLDAVIIPDQSTENTEPSIPSTTCGNGEHERKNQEIVNKLSKLTKKYLAHLDNTITINTDNLMISKYTITMDLNSILDDTSKNASTKLLEFGTRLQEADKGILKNHREPKWSYFKQVALFFLGLTGIGAIIGGVDYAIRRHHSIFCTPKSHGERFVLDIEEHISPAIAV